MPLVRIWKVIKEKTIRHVPRLCFYVDFMTSIRLLPLITYVHWRWCVLQSVYLAPSFHLQHLFLLERLQNSHSILRNAKTYLCMTTKIVWLLDRQTDRQTDRCRTKWSLCAAMLGRQYKKDNKYNSKFLSLLTAEWTSQNAKILV